MLTEQEKESFRSRLCWIPQDERFLLFYFIFQAAVSSQSIQKHLGLHLQIKKKLVFVIFLHLFYSVHLYDLFYTCVYLRAQIPIACPCVCVRVCVCTCAYPSEIRQA